MSRAVHNLLNSVLPMPVRTMLRRGAVAAIPSMRHLDMPFRLAAMARNGFEPAVIYDIGAATGDWARLAHGIWPRARIIGFEPNQSRLAGLERTRAEVPGFEYHRCFLGASAGEVKYADQQDQTSLYMPRANASGTATAPMLVLDELITSGRIPLPQLMKLDVQGYELEVLRGATMALKASEAALLECNVYRLSPGMPTLREVLEFMWRAGFLWYDIAGILRRQRDDALAHLDLLFVKQDHALVQDSWE